MHPTATRSTVLRIFEASKIPMAAAALEAEAELGACTPMRLAVDEGSPSLVAHSSPGWLWLSPSELARLCSLSEAARATQAGPSSIAISRVPAQWRERAGWVEAALSYWIALLSA